MALKHFASINQQTNGQDGNPEPPIFDFDPSIAPFIVAVQVFIVGGSGSQSYNVEFTLDDLELVGGVPNPNVRWTTDPQFPQGSSTTITGNYFAPIRAVRLNVVTTGGATFEFKSRQGDVIH